MNWVAKLACIQLRAEGRSKAWGLEQSWQEEKTAVTQEAPQSWDTALLYSQGAAQEQSEI